MASVSQRPKGDSLQMFEHSWKDRFWFFFLLFFFAILFFLFALLSVWTDFFRGTYDRLKIKFAKLSLRRFSKKLPGVKLAVENLINSVEEISKIRKMNPSKLAQERLRELAKRNDKSELERLDWKLFEIDCRYEFFCSRAAEAYDELQKAGAPMSIIKIIIRPCFPYGLP